MHAPSPAPFQGNPIMPPISVTSFKQPPWCTTERESPASSRAGTPPRTPPNTPPRTPPNTPPGTPPAARRAAAASGNTFPRKLPDEFGGVRFSTELLDLSQGTGADPSLGMLKLQRALALGDGRMAGVWVKLPNGMPAPMIVRRHGHRAFEIALLYEKRQDGAAAPIARGELLERLKAALATSSKGGFKCYGGITEVWKTSREDAQACHRRITEALHWHASAGRTLREGLTDEKGLQDLVGDPSWQRMQAQRARRNSLGFALPQDDPPADGARPSRDDMTKVIMARVDKGTGQDAFRSSDVLRMPVRHVSWRPGEGRSPTASWQAGNRTVLLDITPLPRD